MEVRTNYVYTVGKNETKHLLNCLEENQIYTLIEAENVSNEDDLKVVIEMMGTCQGIINSVNMLCLINEEQNKDYIKNQQDIADAIKKSADSLADRQAHNK